ncbi:hypothetical protein GCM10027167_64910 [Nocardia heshunensis]
MATMPPERRRVAVVRPDTGRLSTISPAPVMAATYAAKAATTTGAGLVDSAAVIESNRAAVDSGSAPLSSRGCASTAPVRRPSATGSGMPVRCVRQ